MGQQRGTSRMFSVNRPSEDYRPRPAPLFRPSRIILAKGSNCTDRAT